MPQDLNQKLKNTLKFIGFFGFGLLLLWLVYRYLDDSYIDHCATEGIPQDECSLVARVIDDFKNANLVWVIVAILLYMISNIYRTLQWQMLLKPISHKPSFANAFWATMLGYFTNLGLPRMGEFIKSGALSQNENIPYEKVFSSVVVSRVLDMMFLGLTTLIAMALEYDKIVTFWSDVAEEYGFSSLYILGGIGLIGLVILIWIVRSPPSSNTLIHKVQNLATGFKDGLISIKDVDRPMVLIFQSMMIWVMYVLMTYIGFWTYEPTSSLSFSAGLVVFVIGALGFVVPSSGGMGTYHALTIIGLSFYGIDKFDAFSYAMILFITLQVGANILFGVLSLIILPRINTAK